MVEVRKCYHSSYVVCLVVFLLVIVLTIIIKNYMYHMTKYNLLLVVCRSWNDNIDAGLCIIKV